MSVRERDRDTNRKTEGLQRMTLKFSSWIPVWLMVPLTKLGKEKKKQA